MEHAEDMRPVFREEEKHSNSKEREQDQPARRPHPAMLLGWIMGGHRFLPVVCRKLQSITSLTDACSSWWSR